MHRSALHRATVPAAVSELALGDRIRRVCGEPAYLRRAPPGLYVTCDADRRHCAHLLDSHRHATSSTESTGAASASAADDDGRVPYTSGVFVLRSTAMDDVTLADTAASSSLLIDVPEFTDPDAWVAFLRAYEMELSGLHTVALTELQTYTSLAVRHLLALRPTVTVCCSPFLAALLTDETFFAGVKRAVLERASASSEAVHALHEVLQFAQLPAAQVRTVAHGDDIVVDAKAPPTSAARRISALHVSTAASLSNNNNNNNNNNSAASSTPKRTTAPAFFSYTPVYYHDAVFESLHVGSSIARVPWLPQVVPEVARETVLPRPPLLARRGIRVGAREARDGPLLRTWQVEEDASAMAAALRSVPTTQHVLSNAFGELDGDVEDVAQGLAKSGHALEQLRSRLARRLETDTSGDPVRWTAPLREKVVRELLMTHTAHPATTPETVTEVLDWARQPETVLNDVASALAYSAVTLPPSAEDEATTRRTASRADSKVAAVVDPAPSSSSSIRSRETKRVHASVEQLSEPSSDFEGAKGVELLQAIFTKKGLHGLGKAAAREDVDVKVFLAMTPGDFRRVFKTTLGISKKLELLQQEIRKNLS